MAEETAADGSDATNKALKQALSNVAAMRKNASEQMGSELVADETDDVYIDSRPAQLNVSYSCFDKGNTRVTVSLPLKLGYLEWTWIKKCPAATWAGVASIVPNVGGGTVKADQNAGVTWGKVNRSVVAGGEARIAGGDGHGWAGNDAAAAPPRAGDEPGARASIMPQPSDGRATVLAYGQLTDEEDGDSDSLYSFDRTQPLDEIGGHHVNDPNEEHSDADSKDFVRVNTLIVASTHKSAKANKGDVFHLDDGLRSKYKRPANAAGLSTLAIIPADVERTSFFVATTRSSQAVMPPTVQVPHEVRNIGINPSVLLHTALGVSSPLADAGVGSSQRVELRREAEPLEFVIEWHCTGVAGITPAIVSVPLLPTEAGVLSFYVGKMCAGESSNGASGRSGRGSSFYLVLLLGVMTSVGAMYYFGTKGGKEQLSTLIAQGMSTVNSARRPDTMQRGEYEIVSQKVPRRSGDGI